MTTVPFSTLDTFHSLLIDDDQFNEAMMRVALQVAKESTTEDTDEQDLYDIAMELCTRVCVS